MTAVRRRTLAAVLLALLAADVIWGPGSCKGCDARPAVTR